MTPDPFVYVLPGPQTLTYAYSALTGNLASITAPGSTLAYAYDGSLLTSTTWTGTVAGSVSRSYDTNFRITSQSVDGANPISFGYDTDSLLTSAGSETISRRADNGLISGTSLGTVTDSRSYSTFGELSGYTANVSGSPVFSVTYTRDKLGRITQKVETLSGVTDTFDYSYDQAGRLREVKKNGTVTATYAYDSNGNRLSRTTSSGTVSGTYDVQDRLSQYGSTTYAHTANGELQSTTTSGQTTTYQYDVLGNLKSVVGPTGTTIEYVVDGQNRRIGKKLNGVLQQGFLYQNQLNVVAELDGSGAVISRFVYGTKANVPDYMVKGGVTYRIVADHLGSPRLVVNTADGSVAQRLDYDEFGNITQDTAPGFQPFGFAGGLSDQHTGLVRFGARDYDAVTGRWTAKDPVLFIGGDTNLYSYTLADPVNSIDPAGFYSLDQLSAIIYNETSGLRGNLIEADVAIGHVAVNRETPGAVDRGIANPQLSPQEEQAIRNGVPAAQVAYGQAVVAAAIVLASQGCPSSGAQDPTRGAKHFILDYGQPLPKWAQGQPVLNYGPFVNAAGGGDVPRNAPVFIRVYP